MKTKLSCLLLLVFLLVSCRKNEPETVTKLKSHRAEIGAGCYESYIYCLSQIVETSGDDVNNNTFSIEAAVCEDLYGNCLIGNLETYNSNGGSWYLLAEITSRPNMIDLEDNSIDVEFKFYDVDNETYVSDPSDFAESVNIVALGYDENFNYLDDIDANASISLSGNTFTATIVGPLLEEYLGESRFIDLRLDVDDESIPYIPEVNEAAGHLDDHVTLMVEQNE